MAKSKSDPETVLKRTYPRQTNLVHPKYRSTPPTRRPSRPPPIHVFKVGEVHPAEDPDQTTMHGEDWEEEVRRRWERNVLIKERLRQGDEVEYCSSGWSMLPRIHSGDTCTFESMCGTQERLDIPIYVGDCVFCQVAPGDRYFAHEVLRIKEPSLHEATVYTIGNAKGTENGTCYRHQIYGRLTSALYIARKK